MRGFAPISVKPIPLAIAAIGLCQVAFAKDFDPAIKAGIREIESASSRAHPNEIPIRYDIAGNQSLYSALPDLTIRGALSRYLYPRGVRLVVLKLGPYNDASGEGFIFFRDDKDSISTKKFQIAPFSSDPEIDVTPVAQNLYAAISEVMRVPVSLQNAKPDGVRCDSYLLSYALELAQHDAKQWRADYLVRPETDSELIERARFRVRAPEVYEESRPGNKVWDAMQTNLIDTLSTVERILDYRPKTNERAQFEDLKTEYLRYKVLADLSSEMFKRVCLTAVSDIREVGEDRSVNQDEEARYAELFKDRLELVSADFRKKLKGLSSIPEFFKSRDEALSHARKRVEFFHEPGRIDQPSAEHLENLFKAMEADSKDPIKFSVSAAKFNGLESVISRAYNDMETQKREAKAASERFWGPLKVVGQVALGAAAIVGGLLAFIGLVGGGGGRTEPLLPDRPAPPPSYPLEPEEPYWKRRGDMLDGQSKMGD